MQKVISVGGLAVTVKYRKNMKRMVILLKTM